MNFINRILLKIAESLDGTSNKVSSVRLQSYIILFPILLMVLVFLIIEIWSFIHAIKTASEYKMSSEIIIVFGMTLSHHITILFSRSKVTTVSDVKKSIAEISGDKPAPVDAEPTTDVSVEVNVDKKD